MSCLPFFRFLAALATLACFPAFGAVQGSTVGAPLHPTFGPGEGGLSVNITSNTTIGCNDSSLDGRDLIVSGAILTVDCEHTFRSLTLMGGATLTHTPQQLQGFRIHLDGDLIVDATSVIGANGSGYASNEGPGAGGLTSSGTGSGGSHGGEGGYSSSGARSGLTYGTVLEPDTAGSGGGYIGGGRGGGVVQLYVGGTALIDGRIDCNGTLDGGSGPGGGAGGSIVLFVGRLEGSGLIRANGSGGDNSGSSAGGSGGGGGRIHVRAADSQFGGILETRPGGGWQNAGPGSVVTDGAGFGGRTLTIDGRGITGNVTTPGALFEFDGDLVVRGGARFGARAGETCEIRIAGDMFVEDDGSVWAALRGHLPNEGAGAGEPASTSFGRGSGGSHGGTGNTSASGFRAGPTYGDFREPVTFGSGGGTQRGGSGGGSLKLVVGGMLDLEGFIQAYGGNGGEGAGGGAGGSVWIQASRLTGGGVISVDGGAGDNSGSVSGASGGGGGRIAVEADFAAFSGQYLCAGGSGWGRGGPGSIYLLPSRGTSELIFDNRALGGATTDLAGVVSIDGDMTIRPGSYVGPLSGIPLTLNVAGTLNVEVTAILNGNGRGWPGNAGPGKGLYPSFGRGSGGAFGGRGAPSSSGYSGGQCYGDVFEPVSLGSGGGYLGGGAGGGSITVNTTSDVIVDGEIRASGNNGGEGSGGGSGGTINIRCRQLQGTGLVRSLGGAGDNSGSVSGASGGGGGRISIRSELSPFQGLIQTCGGSGWSRGAAGTLWHVQSTIDDRRLTIDNCGSSGARTELVGPLSVPGDLVVTAGGQLSAREQERMELSVARSVTVEPLSYIHVNSYGHLANEGPGAGEFPGFGRGSGGGHGGVGGDSSTGSMGGAVYGSAEVPVALGSGGGYVTGGQGGGSMYLAVQGNLHVDGGIEAYGSNGGEGGGGGAGGSILIESGTLSGQGLIRARGGTGDNSGSVSGASGGGGGRIAIYTRCDPELDPSLVQVNGGGGWRSGAPGTIFYGYLPPMDGDIALSSADAGSGLVLGSGTLIQDVFQLNNGVPPFDSSWVPLQRQLDQSGDDEYRCVPEGIIGADGAVVETPLGTSLTSLLGGAFENSSVIRAIPESGPIVLGAPLALSATEPGVYDEAIDLQPGAAPAGTAIRSFIIHVDPSQQQEVFLSGSLTFDQDIAGLILSASDLDASDGLLGAPGVLYPTALGRRALDFDDATEAVTLMPDRRTVLINVRTRDVIDQMRIITVEPTPSLRPYVSTMTPLVGVDEVSLDGCSSGFYRFTFDLPPGFTNPILEGVANVSPQATVYLNGVMISGRMTAPQCEPNPDAGPNQACYDQVDAGTDRLDAAGLRIMTTPFTDCFRCTDPTLFSEGMNELVFGVCASASYWQPTGLEFRAAVNFD